MVFTACDDDRDGKLSYREFVRMLKGEQGALPARHFCDWITACAARSRRVPRLREGHPPARPQTRG